MTANTDEVTASYVYEFSNELVVELTGVDDDGDIVVRSYQFEPDGERVDAKTPVESPFEPHVADALASEGYVWQTG